MGLLRGNSQLCGGNDSMVRCRAAALPWHLLPHWCISQARLPAPAPFFAHDAAMLGFMVAIATELTTQQSVWSQIAGETAPSWAHPGLSHRPIKACTCTPGRGFARKFAALWSHHVLCSRVHLLCNGLSALTPLLLARPPACAGKYVDRDLVEKPLGASVLFFGFVVVATALASFAPQVYKGEGPASRSFGPFTPKAELSNGR